MAYILVAWLLLQVCAVSFPALLLPSWALTFVTVILAIGFPIALMLAWAFDLTPDGVKSESTGLPIAAKKFLGSRHIDFVIIALMAIIIAMFAADKFMVGDQPVESLQASITPTPSITLTQVPAQNVEAPGSAEKEPEEKSIAVLPFVNMSDDEDYFADGLSEEILNLLAKNAELKVAGRTSSFCFQRPQ